MSVDALYDELVAHYPEMKNNPEQWKEHIRLFIEHRPKDQPDEVFKANLKNTLLAKLEEEKQAPRFPLSVLLFGGLGGVVVAGLVFAVWLQALPQDMLRSNPYMGGSTKGQPVPTLDAPALEANGTLISVANEEKPESFGTLTFDPNNANSINASATNAPRPQSGGGGPAMDSKMGIMPPSYGERINIEYTVEGTLPPLPSDTKVYKKQIFNEGVNPSNFIGSGSVIRFDNFSNMIAQSISMKATIGDAPFFITINADMGSVSVSQDYQYLMRFLCPDPMNCYQGPITKAELMTDSAMIAKASSFLGILGVNTSMTGTPYIEKSWLMEGSDPNYIPEIISVVFPFTIDGQEITTPWESKEGIRVNINQRSKEVSDAFIPSLSLLASNYAVSDAATLTDQARKGGMYGVSYNNPDRVVQVILKNPRIELRPLDQFREGGVTETFYLPMLIFDTEKKDAKDQYYIPSEIAVPLVKNTAIK